MSIPAAMDDVQVPGYRIVQVLGGTAQVRWMEVQAPDGSHRLWKRVEMRQAAAAVETRLLGLLRKLKHPYLNAVTNSFSSPDKSVLVIESNCPNTTLLHRL